ncbi:MAG: hypothetical protein O7C59_05010, partial [Rickettsia endosymbiont of Ixodes persulcatus]|nr:hypothetical protein [Rickettsia endosymbiont of Ixodes persulcatus]
KNTYRAKYKEYSRKNEKEKMYSNTYPQRSYEVDHYYDSGKVYSPYLNRYKRIGHRDSLVHRDYDIIKPRHTKSDYAYNRGSTQARHMHYRNKGKYDYENRDKINNRYRSYGGYNQERAFYGNMNGDSCETNSHGNMMGSDSFKGSYVNDNHKFLYFDKDYQNGARINPNKKENNYNYTLNYDYRQLSNHADGLNLTDESLENWYNQDTPASKFEFIKRFLNTEKLKSIMENLESDFNAKLEEVEGLKAKNNSAMEGLENEKKKVLKLKSICRDRVLKERDIFGKQIKLLTEKIKKYKFYIDTLKSRYRT